MLTNSDILGLSLFGVVYVFGLIFAAATAPKKQGLWDKLLFGVLIPVFWPFVFFYVFYMRQDRNIPSPNGRS